MKKSSMCYAIKEGAGPPLYFQNRDEAGKHGTDIWAVRLPANKARRVLAESEIYVKSLDALVDFLSLQG